MKRLILALVGGIICAGICAVGRSALIPDIALPVLLASAIGNRILIGFVIGISRLRMHYLLHGALIGFVVTCAYSVSMFPENVSGALLYTASGTVFGIMIELFVTKVCGAAR
jgi:hypothetical protein